MRGSEGEGGRERGRKGAEERREGTRADKSNILYLPDNAGEMEKFGCDVGEVGHGEYQHRFND